MKSYTDLEQSKKLVKILPLKSADMRYGYIAPYDFSDRMYDGGYDDIPYPKDFLKKNPNFSENEYDGEYPCWSLAALLEELNRNCWKVSLKCCDAEWDITYDDGERYISVSADYAIDACVEMIIKLHEQNLL